MIETLKNLKWTVIGPVGLVALAIVMFIVFDAAKGGEAKQPAPLGELGTPVRNAYIPPTATPIGLVATPRPRPTFAGALKGTSADRDAKRRGDRLQLLAAANKLKATAGSYPSTNNNVQTVCAFKGVDTGCAFKDALGTEIPSDPSADPVKNGYWYSSDGQSLKFYAALEGDVPDDQKCPTTDTELKKKLNLICIKSS